MADKKVRVMLEVEIEIAPWITPIEAANNVQRRISSFLYPGGMDVTAVTVTDVLVKRGPLISSRRR